MLRPSLLRARAAWRPSGVRLASHGPASRASLAGQYRRYGLALLSLGLVAGCAALGEWGTTVVHLDSSVRQPKRGRAVGLEELASHAGGKQGSWIVLDGEVYE